MASSLSVMVVTPRPLVECGVRLAVKTSPQLQLLEMVPDDQMMKERTQNTRPQLLVFDAGSQPLLQLKDLRKLKHRWPLAHTLIMVSDYNRQTQAFLSKAGASDWCLDSISGPDLVQRLVRLSKRPRRVVIGSDEALDPRCNSVSALTAREHDVLDMLAQGLSNKDIAGHLGLTEFTIKSYLKVIYNKLQVSNRVEATLVLHNHHRAI